MLADEAANDALVGLGQDSKPRKDADVSLVLTLSSLSTRDFVGLLVVHERPDLLNQTLFMCFSVQTVKNLNKMMPIAETK